MSGLTGICLHALFTSAYVGLVVSVAWELRLKLWRWVTPLSRLYV